MVITAPEGIKTDTVTVEPPAEYLLSLLRQECKIELPSERLCLLPDVSEFFCNVSHYSDPKFSQSFECFKIE